LLPAAKFICQRLLYVCIVVPLIAVCAFFVIPRAMHLCGLLLDPMTIVEPIQIPDSFKDRGYTDMMLQHMLVDTLNELREKAKGVTPATDTEKILTEFKLPDFSVPGTDLSVRPLIEFTRTLLKRDSSVYGGVIGSPDRFTIVLTLRDPDGHIVSLNEVGASEGASRSKARVKQRPIAGGEATPLRIAALAPRHRATSILRVSYLKLWLRALTPRMIKTTRRMPRGRCLLYRSSILMRADLRTRSGTRAASSKKVKATENGAARKSGRTTTGALR
jgi:hypothetical protein